MYNKILKIWQEKNIDSEAKLAQLMDERRISFAYNSGKLENDSITYHDTREIFDHDGVTSYTGDLRTLFELRNAKEADEFLLKSFGEGRVIDEAFVKELQGIVTKNTYDNRRYALGERPGEYKLHDYVTGEAEVGAAAEDVAEELGELLEELQEIPSEKALVAAAYFHVKFENIHPFADGNGRTGRLLLNYFLVSHNHPPVIIHQEDRREYYACLQAWDESQELDEMIAFLKAQAAKTWENEFGLVKDERKRVKLRAFL